MTTVLIAEDNGVNRELLRELLEARGHTVVEACNGEEALRLLDQSKPGILLLDLGMPVLDGYATVRRVRENPALAMLPVLAVTAYAMQGDKERILESGFAGYLSKPITPVLLFQELDRLMQPKGEDGVTNTIEQGTYESADPVRGEQAGGGLGSQRCDCNSAADLRPSRSRRMPA